MTEYNRLPSMDLRPEITTEWEFGLTTHLFNNRLDIDAAYYNKSTKDQIISASLAPESRYTSMTRNEIHLIGTCQFILSYIIP